MKKDMEMQDTVAVHPHRENAHKRARGREKEREKEKESEGERGTLNHHIQPEVKKAWGKMNVKICGSAGHTEIERERKRSCY